MATTKATAGSKAKSAAKPATATASKTASAAPAKTRTSSAKSEAKPAAPAKAAARKSPTAKVDPELRRHYVEVAAYYIAERRGFLGGCETEDWVTAEREIDLLLQAGKLSA